MKVCLFLTLVLAVVELKADNIHLTDAQKRTVNRQIAKCVKESGVKSEVMEVAKRGHYPEDQGLKKFLLCFYNDAGILSPDAQLNIDVALSKLNPRLDKTETKKALEKCKTKTGKDPAEIAFNIFKCYNDEVKTHIVF